MAHDFLPSREVIKRTIAFLNKAYEVNYDLIHDYVWDGDDDES